MTPPPADEGAVVVERRQVRFIRDLVVGVAAGVLVLGVGLVVRSLDTDRVNDRQDEADERLTEQADRLETLIRRENHEEEVEQAQACVSSHERHAGLFQLLHIVAPEHEQEVAELYPPPSCDVEGAARVIAGG